MEPTELTLLLKASVILFFKNRMLCLVFSVLALVWFNRTLSCQRPKMINYYWQKTFDKCLENITIKLHAIHKLILLYKYFDEILCSITLIIFMMTVS